MNTHLELGDEIRDALEHVFKLAKKSRDALIERYAAWPDDRGLGPPFDLDPRDHPDDLPSLRDRLTEAGGPGRLLSKVIRDQAALDHLLLSYDKGLFAGYTVAEWRTQVQQAFGEFAESILEVMKDLATWSPAPDATVLVGREVLFTDDVARLLGIKVDSARKRMNSGQLGPVLRVGGRLCVLRDDMFETLREQSGETEDAEEGRGSPEPPQLSEDLLKDLGSSRRRGSRAKDAGDEGSA